MDVLTKLKFKAIEDYDKAVARIEKGHREDLKEIIDIICFIDSYKYLDNSYFIANNLLNGR